MADGHRQRLARLLQRRRRCTRRWTRSCGSPASCVAAGADIMDVGGESASTGRPPVEVQEEIERVVPLIERVADELGAIVSVDTYKPAVAARRDRRRARAIVNDVSGLRDPSWPRSARRRGAALVRDAHARGAQAAPAGPRSLRRRGRRGARVPARAHRRWRSRAGVAREQLIVDPGPDFAKTPAQTIALLARRRAPARAGAPAADGDLAQGLHRRAHRPRRRASGWRGHARRARPRRGRGRAHLSRPRRRRRGGLPRRARGARGRARARAGIWRSPRNCATSASPSSVGRGRAARAGTRPLAGS